MMTVMAVELAIRMPLVTICVDISSVGLKSLHVLGSKSISEHWKEKVMLAYACRLLRLVAKLLAVLAVIAGLLTLLVLALESCGMPIADFVASWTGVLFATAIAAAYFAARKRFV